MPDPTTQCNACRKCERKARYRRSAAQSGFARAGGTSVVLIRPTHRTFLSASRLIERLRERASHARISSRAGQVSMRHEARWRCRGRGSGRFCFLLFGVNAKDRSTSSRGDAVRVAPSEKAASLPSPLMDWGPRFMMCLTSTKTCASARRPSSQSARNDLHKFGCARRKPLPLGRPVFSPNTQ
jgi:hypothetical protein